jgi:gamma-glutamyltranspeptidase/glutathione hydrolase
MRRFLLTLSLAVFAGGRCLAADATAAPTAGATAVGHGGMVVSVSRPASDVGRQVLERGGNAVDAAVAVAFALAVTWPEAGNLGGGGFMLIYRGGNREPIVIDYREKAPAAATRDMFAAEGEPSPYAMVGVPGTVRGLKLAHRRAGRLPWKSLLTPAVTLAADGFAVDDGLAQSLNRGLKKSQKFPEFQRVFGNGNGEWKAGDRLVQPELAETLRAIADRGIEGFYSGPVAAKIVAEMKAGGGLITAADLADYAAKERVPVHGTYRGFDVYAPPPPSSGGICLIEMLNVLENFDLRKQGRWSPDTLHQMTEAMRRAYCDRARHLGDSDFVNIPGQLTDKAYAKQLAAAINPDKATASADLANDITLTDDRNHTTHFSVIDRDGMAVSNTYTLEDSFGGKVVVRGAGFLLNNEMGDFNPRPGMTNRRGQIGTLPNQVAPGKRMLSSMCPTIVSKDGRAVLVTGSPGGRTIINTVLCVVVNVIDFDMPLREAIDAPRMHHQWLPDGLLIDKELRARYAPALDELRKRGHAIVVSKDHLGDAHSIAVSKDGYIGVADRRTSGWAAGN